MRVPGLMVSKAFVKPSSQHYPLTRLWIGSASGNCLTVSIAMSLLALPAWLPHTNHSSRPAKYVPRTQSLNALKASHKAYSDSKSSEFPISTGPKSFKDEPLSHMKKTCQVCPTICRTGTDTSRGLGPAPTRYSRKSYMRWYQAAVQIPS